MLVDDRSGVVVQDLDVLQPVNRVVCDNHNFMTFPDVACTSDFARTEHGPKSKVKDVNDAFELAGAVSRFYRQIGHLDLTRMLGADEGDHRSLSSTVRFCDPLAPPANCPMQNAFWNGVGMFYGDGYASADDVVGHEMTHGVISRNADLFYWGSPVRSTSPWPTRWARSPTTVTGASTTPPAPGPSARTSRTVPSGA